MVDMTDVLVLGGTGWLSERIATRWRDAGARVTCLARGGRPSPAGTVLLRGDRDDPGGYEQLRAQHWDEVVDVSRHAKQVREAVAALGGSTDHFTFVSSVSVYADETTLAQDESAPLHEPARDGDEYDYAAQKVAAEQAVRMLGERAFIVRPGLIVGAGDPSDRFGYWAAAFARAGSEPVLTPTADGRFAQIIDVDDLAGYVTAELRHGTVNATGDVRAFADVMAAVREAAGHTGEMVEADDEWLVQQGVQYWMGERSLPLWVPDAMRGFMRRENDAYRASGGGFTPLSTTIRAVLDDERARGLDRERGAGLRRADELELLGRLPQSRAD